MKVDLKWFSGPDEPEEICGEAAALCYKSKNPGSALRSALRMGHESVLEHASFTFVIEGISRVALAQLTRHRLCSFSVVSQRYTGIEGQRFVIPETIKNTIVNQCDNYLADIWNNAIDTILSAYSAFIIAGIPEEDARYIIPQGITCDLIMTANAR